MRYPMNVSRKAGQVGLACASLLGLYLFVFVRSRNAAPSLEKSWTTYAHAQRTLQQELADFFINRRPDLKENFEVNRDLQLALIERRSLEFRYLLSAHPEQIVSDQGVSRFANYRWTEENQNALRHTSPEYEAARKRVEELSKRNEEASRKQSLHEAQQGLAKDAELQKIYQRFEEREQAVQKMLKAGR